MPAAFSRRRFLTATSVALSLPYFVPDALASEEEKWGDLIGRIVYDGPPPRRKKLKVDKDVECCGEYDIRDESLMVGEKGGLANVFVYCRERRVDICPELEDSTEKKVLLENSKCIFMPHCLSLWFPVQELYTTNTQPIADNVAFSPFGDRAANIVLPPGTPEKPSSTSWRFRRAQRVPVKILCNYHPWEVAYILPLDHPYVAITEKDGSFRIPKLPIGKLRFQVWHERTGYLQTEQWKRGQFEIEIQPGNNDLGTITLPPKMFEKES
jgi:hypothetical protein